MTDIDHMETLKEQQRMSNLELMIAYENQLARWRSAAYFLAGYMANAGHRGYPLPERNAQEWIEEAFGHNR